MSDDSKQSSSRYAFGPFEFWAASRELRRDGRIVPLPDQAGRVLAELLRFPGETVTRDHLIQTLWPGRVSGDSEGGLHTAVRKLRRALDDDGCEPRYIGTLSKRGYRLLVPVNMNGTREPLNPETPPAPSETVEPARPPRAFFNRIRRNSKLVLLGALLLCFGTGLAVWLFSRNTVRTFSLPGGLKLEMVHFPPDAFYMGFDSGYKPSEPIHKVTLTRGFWMGRTEVTQAQWRAVMGHNPSYFQGDDRPVEQVSWDDCQTFLARLNQLVPDLVLRLPTEAEWEYASRKASHGSNIAMIDAYAWHAGNSLGQTHPAATKAPNTSGLHDMVGNVWEWCADGYGPLKPSPQQDPLGAVSELRSVRGGSCLSPSGGQGLSRKTADRVTLRYGYPPDYTTKDLGFRIVAVPRSR